MHSLRLRWTVLQMNNWNLFRSLAGSSCISV